MVGARGAIKIVNTYGQQSMHVQKWDWLVVSTQWVSSLLNEVIMYIMNVMQLTNSFQHNCKGHICMVVNI
jgi:hypothetical protein